MAFSSSNAGAKYSEFFNSLDELNEINWPAVKSTDFRPDAINEGKQAEFLIKRAVPWELVETIGAIDRSIAARAAQIIENQPHRPLVKIQRGWYY